jgi:predicted transcriptional regulator
LLRIIREQQPESLEELAQITARAKSNLSRTLKTMAAYGLVRMERGKGLRLVPRLIHDRVELVLPLAERRKTKGTRK